MSKIKDLVKTELGKSLDAGYSKRVQGLDMSFDTWIRTKEKNLVRYDMTVDKGENAISDSSLSYAAKYEGITIRIIPYEKITVGFSVKGFLEDIIVFTNGELTDRALPLFVKNFEEFPEADIFYGDEDIALLADGSGEDYGRTVVGTREHPYFKPDFSPNAFLDRFYFGNIFAIRRASFRDFNFKITKPGIEGMYESLVLYIFGQKSGYRGNCVKHIDEILIHVKNYDNTKLEIKGSLDDILPSLDTNVKKTITAVIPSKDNPELLEKCIKALKECVPNDVSLEIKVIDNGSAGINKDKITELSRTLNFSYDYCRMEFNFSKMCNRGALEATGDFLLFLNDDVEFTDKESLSLMLNEAMGVYTGAVGLKLLYPDLKRIQHAGVINTKIGPVHKLQFMEDSLVYYHGFNRHVQNVLAVTGACLLVKKEIFNRVGGFNEDLPIAFNDIDLCFKLHEAGLANTVINKCPAIHRESVTRGRDTDVNSVKRLEGEREKLYTLHPDLRGRDPYYSKYLNSDCLDVNISPASEYELERALEDPTGRRSLDISKYKAEACLQLSVEYAGPMDRFVTDSEFNSDRKELLLQGFAFVQGTDNALYKKTLILENKEGKQAFGITFKGCLRKDVARACPDEKNLALSGFSLRINRGFLAPGEYRVGVLFEKYYSKEKLYTFSNKYLVVK